MNIYYQYNDIIIGCFWLAIIPKVAKSS